MFSNPIREYGNIRAGHHTYAWISMVKSSIFLPKGLSNPETSLRFTLKSKIFHLDKEGLLACQQNPSNCHFVHLYHSDPFSLFSSHVGYSPNPSPFHRILCHLLVLPFVRMLCQRSKLKSFQIFVT